MKYFLTFSLLAISRMSASEVDTQDTESFDSVESTTVAAIYSQQQFLAPHFVSEGKGIGFKRPHPDTLKNEEGQSLPQKKRPNSPTQDNIPVLQRKNAEKH